MRNLVIMLSVMLMLAAALPLYAACESGDCKNGEGTYVWPNGMKYTGQYKNGKMDGFGTFTWPSGDTYTGQWKNNMKEGRNIYISYR